MSIPVCWTGRACGEPAAAVPTEDFQRLIWLSYDLETRAPTNPERERIRFVREALDSELIVKQYQELMARRSCTAGGAELA